MNCLSACLLYWEFLVIRSMKFIILMYLFETEFTVVHLDPELGVNRSLVGWIAGLAV